MADGVEISGLVETQRMLIELPGEITRDMMPRALVAGSVPIQEELLKNAPERDREDGGEYEFPPLDQSIITDVEVDGLSGVASTGFGEAGPVALWNEDGHEIVTHAKVDTGKKTEPNPFMRRSTDNAAEAAIDAVCDSLIASMGGRY